MTQSYPIATVFGGTGFIGSQVVRALAKQGIIVKIPARIPERAYDLKPCGSVGQIVPMACNVNDPASINAAVRGSDIVVNCIGILFQRRRATFQAIHVDLARRIAEACRDNGVGRLVHISSLGVDKAQSRYALTKRAGEQAVLTAFPRATVLRPAPVFGPDDHFTNMFAGMARALPLLPLIGGGHTKLQPIYVGDVAGAVLSAALLPDNGHGPCGRIYELGGPKVMDFKELYTLILGITGRKRGMMPLPWFVAKMQAAILQCLPGKLLTPDQVETLKTDSMVAPDALTLAHLGIEATDMTLVLPGYLDKYRAGGRFGAPLPIV